MPAAVSRSISSHRASLELRRSTDTCSSLKTRKLASQLERGVAVCALGSAHPWRRPGRDLTVMVGIACAPLLPLADRLGSIAFEIASPCGVVLPVSLGRIPLHPTHVEPLADALRGLGHCSSPDGRPSSARMSAVVMVPVHVGACPRRGNSRNVGGQGCDLAIGSVNDLVAPRWPVQFEDRAGRVGEGRSHRGPDPTAGEGIPVRRALPSLKSKAICRASLKGLTRGYSRTVRPLLGPACPGSSQTLNHDLRAGVADVQWCSGPMPSKYSARRSVSPLDRQLRRELLDRMAAGFASVFAWFSPG